MDMTAMVVASVGAPAIVIFPVVALTAVPVFFETSLGDEALRVVGIVFVVASIGYIILVPICLAGALMFKRLGLLRRPPLFLVALLASIVVGLLIGFQWTSHGQPERAIPAGIFFATVIGIAAAVLVEVWLALAVRLSKKSSLVGTSPTV